MGGKGILYDKDGKIEYEGSFKDGKKIIFYENGEYYNGDLVNNIREGNGKYYYCTKSLEDDLNLFEFDSGGDAFQTCKKYDYYYAGEFKNNFRHGKGAIYISQKDKLKYAGDFKNDRVEGNGKIFYASGCTYIGEFKNFSVHGKGKFNYKNGNYYVGEYKNNKRGGKGIIYYEDGDILYEGDFVNNEFEGKGKKDYYKLGIIISVNLKMV